MRYNVQTVISIKEGITLCIDEVIKGGVHTKEGERIVKINVQEIKEYIRKTPKEK